MPEVNGGYGDRKLPEGQASFGAVLIRTLDAETRAVTIGCSLTVVGVLCPRAEGRSEAASLLPSGGYTES